MNRSPLFYPLNRGMDADVGGAADLQTDVMRFMAIISMCLVAIFALVQSIPQPPPAAPPPAVSADAAPSPQAQAVHPDPVLTRPTPPVPASRPEPVALERPKPVARAADRRPPSSAATPAAAGFTLRFESDRALTRLVEQHVVGLFAIRAGTTLRMDVDAGRPGFWPASLPAQFHEMDAATVPDAVLSAYRRRGEPLDGVKWGVSLPAGMSRSLNEYLGSYESGVLVIGTDGTLKRIP